jgi:hypothetical protein
MPVQIVLRSSQKAHACILPSLDPTAKISTGARSLVGFATPNLREGPGQIASLRAKFRLLSRNWHICMEFRRPLPPRDIPDMVHSNKALSLLPAVSKGFPTQGAGHKQSQKEVEEELNS